MEFNMIENLKWPQRLAKATKSSLASDFILTSVLKYLTIFTGQGLKAFLVQLSMRYLKEVSTVFEYVFN